MHSSMAEFAARQVAPRGLYAAQAFPHDLWRVMGEAGLFRIGLGERFGGLGGGYAEIAAAETALVAQGGSLGFGLSWTGHQLVARYFIAGFGKAAQQAEYLPDLAAGRLTAAVAISEPGAGAHPKHLKTTAQRDGDAFVLDGEKAWVTNGPIADLFIVFAVSAVEAGRKRYSAFLVPRQTPGLVLVETPPLGVLRPSPHCGLRLAGCRVPKASLLGEPERAYETMAAPFRDVEDAVATGGLLGAVRHLVQRLARGAAPSPEVTASLGELASLMAVLGHAADAAVAALDAGALPDGDTPATLVGIRALTVHLLARCRAHREAFGGGTDEGADTLLRDLDASLAIAKGPRLVKQSRIGMALLGKRD